MVKSLDILADFCYHGTMMMKKGDKKVNGDYEMKEMLFEMGLHDAVNKKLPVEQHLEYARNYVYKKINRLI